MAERAESPKAKTSKAISKAKTARSHPTLYKMVLEGLGYNKSIKGLTLQSIKRYVIDTYPETKEHFSNLRLRKAMKKGLESSEIIRPKSSENEGLTGHFLLNRAFGAQKDQDKKKKPKPAKEAEGKTAKSPKKAAAAAAKIKPTKSPKKKVANPSKSKSHGKTTPKTKKKSAVKKVKSSFRETPKTSKIDRAGAIAKTASVKKMKTATKRATKTGKN